MNKSVELEKTPFNGYILYAPLHLGIGEMRCWACKKDTKIVAIIATNVEDFEDGKSLGLDENESYVDSISEDEMPEVLAKAINELTQHYRPIYSHTMGETTWANACENCGALQGAFYQHRSSESPFFGTPDYFIGTRLLLLSQNVTVDSEH